MASQLELFLPANYTTHLLSSIYGATNEGIAVLEVWSIFPFTIKCILLYDTIQVKSISVPTRVYMDKAYGTVTVT